MPDDCAETDQKQSQATSQDTSNATSNLAWFLTGAFIGAAAAILYAPQSGKVTRQFITEKTQMGKEAVENAGQDIAEVSKDMFERGRKLVDDAADLFERGRKLVKG
jgi:gas vesicle protein